MTSMRNLRVMTTASGDSFPAEGFGPLDMTVYTFEIPRTLKIKRVMYAPSLLVQPLLSNQLRRTGIMSTGVINPGSHCSSRREAKSTPRPTQGFTASVGVGQSMPTNMPMQS